MGVSGLTPTLLEQVEQRILSSVASFLHGSALLLGEAQSLGQITAAGGSFIGSVILNNGNADITPAGGSGSWTAVVDASETLNSDWCFIGYLLNQTGSVTPSGSWTGSSESAINAIRVDPA